MVVLRCGARAPGGSLFEPTYGGAAAAVPPCRPGFRYGNHRDRIRRAPARPRAGSGRAWTPRPALRSCCSGGFSTVRSPTNRASAIALVLIPRAASLATSRSRRVSETGPSAAAAARRPLLPSRRSTSIDRSRRQDGAAPAKIATACSRVVYRSGAPGGGERPAARRSCARPRCERSRPARSRPRSASLAWPPRRPDRALGQGSPTLPRPRPAHGAAEGRRYGPRRRAAGGCPGRLRVPGVHGRLGQVDQDEDAHGPRFHA